MENENKELIKWGQTSLFFDMAKFQHAEKVAQIFASSSMVPQHFQNNKANCIIALNLAERFQADPFMVMQNIYIVYGKPGIEGKLVIALVNSTGKFTPLQYKLDGKGQEATCFAFATRLDNQEKCEGPVVSIDMAKAEGWLEKQGSKWKTMPGLMLRYRAATFFARTFCPEALLGMQTKEELLDVTDLTLTAGGTYQITKTAEDLTEELKKESEIQKDDHAFKTPEITKQEEIDKLIDEKNKQIKIDKNFRAEWINLGKGYAEYIKKHLDKFNEASPDLILEARNKWLRFIEMKVIPDKPWPLDEKEKTPENEIFEINNWDAWNYMANNEDFNRFKEAYENLGFDIYKTTMKQLGWTAVATSEECRIVADKMGAIADNIEAEKF